MKTDNSRMCEEKFSEGYNERTKEINSANLILIENELYELSEQQMQIFKRLRKGHNFDEYHNRSLDYIRESCQCINRNTKCFNY